MPNLIEPNCPQQNLGYVTDGQSILVFEKLANLLNSRSEIESITTNDGLARQRPTVLEMLQESTISPKRAVQEWRIGHPSYYIDSSESEKIVIRHALLDSQIPVIFDNLLQAQEALAELIMGRIIPGAGDFVYFGQPLLVTKMDEPIAKKCTKKQLSSKTNSSSNAGSNRNLAPIIH